MDACDAMCKKMNRTRDLIPSRQTASKHKLLQHFLQRTGALISLHSYMSLRHEYAYLLGNISMDRIKPVFSYLYVS
jgi:hypothetical protein